MERITLYEELRLIEKSEPEVNGAWKGAHLLLFFLAFVFGSFCTFCFHMLMYLFDEKCVLFPKLLSLTSLRQNIIYEIVPEESPLESSDMLPVDFISTQWVEKSACLLPTYVPLVSGIFGLVWTTMFLMCSTGSRVLIGLQRPWRVLPPVFVFSLAMSVLCVYTSAVTHYGLQELCLKLSEITGSTTCTYTVNVATLAYERRIRGVYQATRLTIFSAWFHTSCWVLSTLLALIRVLLAIDFKLIRVTVQLRGNIDRMLEQHEKQIRTVSPVTINEIPMRYSTSKVLVHFKKKEFSSNYKTYEKHGTTDLGNVLYHSDIIRQPSEPSLVAAERDKLNTLSACNAVTIEHQFIVKMLYHILDTVESKPNVDIVSTSSSTISLSGSALVERQYGQQRISSTEQFMKKPFEEHTHLNIQEAQEIADDIKRHLKTKLNRQLSEIKIVRPSVLDREPVESTMNISSDMKIMMASKNDDLPEDVIDDAEPSTSMGIKKAKLKSNLKQTGVQTEDKVKDKSLKVKIYSQTNVFSSKTSLNEQLNVKENKETQTSKEKQE